MAPPGLQSARVGCQMAPPQSGAPTKSAQSRRTLSAVYRTDTVTNFGEKLTQSSDGRCECALICLFVKREEAAFLVYSPNFEADTGTREAEQKNWEDEEEEEEEEMKGE